MPVCVCGAFATCVRVYMCGLLWVDRTTSFLERQLTGFLHVLIY